MKTFLLATVMALGFTTAALAQNKDTSDRGFFIGGQVGSFTGKNDRLAVGVNGGYQFHRFFRAEVTAENAWKSNSGAGSMVFANIVPQYRIPGTILTPYALAGVGYSFDSLGSVKKGGAVPVYNLGLGMRAAITDRIDADIRYRNVRAFEGKNARVRDDHIFTVGASYKF